MANKYKRIGTLLVSTTHSNGDPLVDNNGNPKTLRSIALGSKSSNPIYQLDVEIIARDGTGKVVFQQINGFLPLQDPRTQPDDLLANGSISQEIADSMKRGLEKMSPKVKYVLEVNTNPSPKR